MLHSSSKEALEGKAGAVFAHKPGVSTPQVVRSKSISMIERALEKVLKVALKLSSTLDPQQLH